MRGEREVVEGAAEAEGEAVNCPCPAPAPASNPRHKGACVRCGKPIAPDTRPRDITLERKLSDSAARAAGYTTPDGGGDTGGLTAWAEHRALPGGVRLNIDTLRETREELADARNYLVWGVEPIYEQYLAGDPLACDRVARNMNALTRIIQAWHELQV